MAEDEKAQFEAMKTMITGGLRQMANDLEGFSKKAKESVAPSGGLKQMDNMFVSMTKNLMGPVSLAAGIYAVTKAMTEFADERLKLQLFSKDVGFSTDTIYGMRRAMFLAGKEFADADKAIAAIGGSLKTLNAERYIAPLYRYLKDLGPGMGEIADQLLTASGNYERSLTIIEQHWKTFNERQRTLFAKGFGVSPSDIDAELDHFHHHLDEKTQEIATEYAKNVRELRLQISEAWEWALGGAVTAAKKTSELLNKEAFPLPGKGGAPNYNPRSGYSQQKLGDERKDDLRSFWDRIFNPGNPRTGGRGPRSDSGTSDSTDFSGMRRAGDLVRNSDDSLKVQTDIRDILQRMEGGGDGGGGGGGSGAFGAGIRRPGGSAQASLGGFRPFGNRNPSSSDPRGLSSYIKETAQKYGIDPDTALRVAQSEGLGTFTGDHGTSFGAFQAHIGGGLGDEFQKQTGKDPSDPKNERDLIDWQLRKASKEGWAPYHGASRVGVGNQMGIGGRPGYGAEGTSGDKSAFIMHHTGGRGTVEGVMSTLRQRGLGVQYIMDREGNIVPAGGSSHMMPGWGKMGQGLSNKNTIGMEVIAKNDSDVTPAQVESARRFMAEKYPNLPVYGHGQVNPGHKEESEGMKIVRAVNADRQTASLIDRDRIGRSADSGQRSDANMNASIDFKNMPSWVKSSVDSNGKFRNLRVTRSTPQNGHAGAGTGEYVPSLAE